MWGKQQAGWGEWKTDRKLKSVCALYSLDKSWAEQLKKRERLRAEGSLDSLSFYMQRWDGAQDLCFIPSIKMRRLCSGWLHLPFLYMKSRLWVGSFHLPLRWCFATVIKSLVSAKLITFSQRDESARPAHICALSSQSQIDTERHAAYCSLTSVFVCIYDCCHDQYYTKIIPVLKDKSNVNSSKAVMKKTSRIKREKSLLK